MDIYHSILKQYWGYDSFRPLQEDIIHSIVAKKDTLGLMPTGGGKSITFQVPALAEQGICIVVTPLISLMKDQVDALRQSGIKATTIYSGMDRQSMITQLENCIYGDYKFLYVSPERLSTDLFQNKLQAMNVSFLVVDECHCISQWGYDFRPAYLGIANLRKLIPHVPVLALTATATPEVITDIQGKLAFKAPNVFVKSFLRKNISYVVRHTDNQHNSILKILQAVPGSSIIYVRSRKKTKEIADKLKEDGISAEHFHAGLNTDEKNSKQTKWKNSQIRVIVATNAFGMGIDKPDVRTVIHIDMPSSLEEYYQEAGRAGRDGKKSYAVVISSKNDIKSLKQRIATEYPDKEQIERVYEALGNFYQIAVGSGNGITHELPLDHFSSTFGFFPTQAHNALKILELAGYIQYHDEAESTSRLIFAISRDELYKIRFDNKQIDSIIYATLRLYSGIFSEYACVNESQIAQQTGCTHTQVYETLKTLSKRHIINYIPQKKIPRITYIQQREDPKYLRIPKNIYDDRKDRQEKRTASVINYITNQDRCRSQILLNYFGETDATDCTVCDICLAKRKSNTNYAPIRDAIISTFAGQSISIHQIVNVIPFPASKIIEAISYYSINDPQFILNGDELTLSNED
jgi:ATP-dependent DNA helicase RecQ